MTRTANARIAGVAFLFYIVAGIAAMILSGRASGDGTVADRLAAVAQHVTAVRISFVLNLLCCFAALVLGVTLYALTREQDEDIALLGLACRIAEGVIGGVFVSAALGRLWLATAASAPDPPAAEAIGALLFRAGAWSPSAMFFAVGSTLYAWLFLRGRMIPRSLAVLGVAASAVLVIALPLDLAGLLNGAATMVIWLPMLVFEVALALWLLLRGVTPAAERAA